MKGILQVFSIIFLLLPGLVIAKGYAGDLQEISKSEANLLLEELRTAFFSTDQEEFFQAMIAEYDRNHIKYAVKASQSAAVFREKLLSRFAEEGLDFFNSTKIEEGAHLLSHSYYQEAFSDASVLYGKLLVIEFEDLRLIFVKIDDNLQLLNPELLFPPFDSLQIAYHHVPSIVAFNYGTEVLRDESFSFDEIPDLKKRMVSKKEEVRAEVVKRASEGQPESFGP
ncbi:MAG: hypothetical protein LAT55_10600 [Opitutales bacterium]|nr:hypothetical protein [Opitutales bacterium]